MQASGTSIAVPGALLWYVAAMLLMLPFWLVLGAILVGWGLLALWLLRRASGGTIRGSLGAFQTLWLGYAGLVAFLVTLSLVLPIARAELGLAIAPAVAGFALERRAVLRRLRELRARPRTTAVIACVVLGAWFLTAYAACDRVSAYDSYLYHLQLVKWNATYAAVPGLANLQDRFGYDNSLFVFGAFVDAFWQSVGVHAMNGFFMAAIFAHWATEIFGARTPRGRLRQTYCLLTLPFLLAKLWYVEVASYSTDLPLAILCLVLVLELLSLPRASRDRLLLPIAYIVALGATATTTKLEGLGLFGVAGIAAIVLVGRGAGRRTWLALAGLPLWIAISWVVRNVIVSGWLVFPIFGRLPLAWSVPYATGHENLRWVESWARMPKLVPPKVLDHGFLHWFVPWFDGFRQSHEMILLAAAIGLVAWRLAAGPARPAAGRAGELAAVAACAAGLAQWFVGAPDVRFGGFLFWTLPAALFAPLVAGAMRDATARAFVLALALALAAWSGGLTPRIDAAVPKLWGRPPAPDKRAMRYIQTGPGTEVAWPVTGDQCGDVDLPCTPYPATQTLRDPKSLGAGFYSAPRS